jgi:KaiC/GvpD/RAD55 family RecA-like ATPase
MGTPATTNPGGSNGWLSAYAEMLAGKKVEIYPDSDKPGEKWLDEVMKSLEGKVSALRVIRTPEPYNDIADMVEAKGAEYASEAIQKVIEKTGWVERGIFIDLLSSREAYDLYAKRVRESEKVGIDFGKWLPTLRHCTRPMMPGDLVVVMADTGVGKTAILTNMAYSQRPLPVVFFELELSAEAMAERFVSRDIGIDAIDVEREVRKGSRHSVEGWSHVFTCPNSRMTTADMEALIVRSELKIGRRPALVMVDYVGLVSGGSGKRYERLSEIAEELKRLARNTNTVVVIASQVKRDEDRIEVSLHDAKDSGSIENSAQLVIGAWRPSIDTMKIKILKQTRMAGQKEIDCQYIGNKQLIREVSHAGH